MFPTLKTMLNGHTAAKTTADAVTAIVPQIRSAIENVWEDVKALNTLKAEDAKATKNMKAARKHMTIRVIMRALDHDFWNAVVMLDEAMKLNCGPYLIRKTSPGWAYIYRKGAGRLWIGEQELETLADAAEALEVPIADLPENICRAIGEAKKGLVMSAARRAD